VSHFTLDVDPAKVTSAAATLTLSEQDLVNGAGTVAALEPQLSAAWEGLAAQSLAAETDGLRRQAEQAAPHFSAARSALEELATAYTTALEVDVPALNARWEQAKEDHDADVARRRQQESTAALSAPFGSSSGPLLPAPVAPWLSPTVTAPSELASARALAATQRALEDEFDALKTLLHNRTRQAGEALAAATVIPVPTEVAATYADGGWFMAITGMLGGGDPSVLSADLPLSALARALQGDLPSDSASLQALLDTARASGLDAWSIANLQKKYWTAKAYERAGIDPDLWNPELGVDANRATILKVYEYYKTLYQLDPHLEWAGLANMVGPGFAAGFFDLDMARDTARYLEDLPGDLPGDLAGGMSDLAGASDEQLEFFETRFLMMQRQIFEDMGAMHEAYLSGPEGIAALEEMTAAGVIRPKVMQAWRFIDVGTQTGDADLLHRGAVGLADREQNQIIADNWDAMYDHPPFGPAVTYLMTTIGKPSVPGALFPGQVRSLEIPLSPDLDLPDEIDLPDSPRIPLTPWKLPDLPSVPLPPDQVLVRTTLPDFNVSDREDRWDYFLTDTMPAYVELLEEQDRVTIETEMSRPIEERIEEQRALNRLPDIMEGLDPRTWTPVVER